MQLNQTLRTFAIYHAGSEESFPEYDVLYQRMQSAAFQVAEVLMGQPSGTMAKFAPREYLIVAPYLGQIETLLVEDYDESREPDDVAYAFINSVEGGDIDLGEDDLERLTEQLTAWLQSPEFHVPTPAHKLTDIVAGAEAWWHEREAEMAAKQSPGLR